MAAGFVTHSITTAAGVTFTVKSWVPDTTAPDVGAVPIAMLTDGTTGVAIGTGGKSAALRVNYANDGEAITVLQGATNGGTWVIEGKSGGTLVPVTINPAQLGTLGQTTGSASVPIVPPNDYGMPLATDKMFAGTTSLTPKFAIIGAASSGDNSIVASVTSKKIRVLALKLIANGAVNAKWRSATTDITGLSYFAAAGDGEVLPFNPVGWFETAVTSALQVNLSAAVATGGHLTYIEV